jgi:transposase-like protein
MSKGTTIGADVIQLRRDVRAQLQRRVLEAIELVLDEELTAAVGSSRYERSPVRKGYRNGVEERRITTAMGTQSVRVPRARVIAEDGQSHEFRSEILPRYARRTREVDDAILGVYLAGGNSRRIRTALKPLLGSENLSKSAVSRIVSRLKEHFAAWRERDLTDEVYAILYLDGFHLKIRLARRVVSVPVLAVLGVAEDGSKRLVVLQIAISEASGHWSSLIADLQKRGLRAPCLVVADGHAGLRKAIDAWPGIKIQRCTYHKWTNLVENCPAHARREMHRDYRRIVNAKDGMAARKAREAFLSKWSELCPAAARSLEEAGEQLLTFYEFPKSMWRSLRTTNPLENLNREFRRRTKTQSSFSTEDAAITLLYGLVAFGQIRMHKIDGHREVKALIAQTKTQAA